MTTTAPSRSLTADGRGRLPAPVRDRRPALAALALLLVLGGALASALIAYRSGDRVDVLVARADIEAGEQVDRSDFRVARVAADGAATIEAAAASNFVGTTATGRIPAGTMLNRSMFLASSSIAPTGSLVVGVVLSASQRPAVELRAGDVVRVFLVPRETGDLDQGVGARLRRPRRARSGRPPGATRPGSRCSSRRARPGRSSARRRPTASP